MRLSIYLLRTEQADISDFTGLATPGRKMGQRQPRSGSRSRRRYPCSFLFLVLRISIASTPSHAGAPGWCQGKRVLPPCRPCRYGTSASDETTENLSQVASNPSRPRSVRTGTLTYLYPIYRAVTEGSRCTDPLPVHHHVSYLRVLGGDDIKGGVSRRAAEGWQDAASAEG